MYSYDEVHIASLDYFNGDELTSPVQQALLFLMQLDQEEREF